MVIQTDFITFCRNSHDSTNQKYGGLPYSFHLNAVESIAHKFWTPELGFSLRSAKFVANGHDLIEDARLTYNDIKQKLISLKNTVEFSTIITEAIFNCSESLGRNREERHDEAYLKRVVGDDLALYVKLCDIYANVLFSTLTNSTMISKYAAEFPKFLSFIKDAKTKGELIPYSLLIKSIKNALKNEVPKNSKN